MEKLALLVAASLVAISGCAADSSAAGAEEPSQTGEDAFTARASTHAIVLTRWAASTRATSSRSSATAIASLTTISTPHRGSAIADVLLWIIPDDLDKAVNARTTAI